MLKNCRIFLAPTALTWLCYMPSQYEVPYAHERTALVKKMQKSLRFMAEFAFSALVLLKIGLIFKTLLKTRNLCEILYIIKSSLTAYAVANLRFLIWCNVKGQVAQTASARASTSVLYHSLCNECFNKAFCNIPLSNFSDDCDYCCGASQPSFSF